MKQWEKQLSEALNIINSVINDQEISERKASLLKDYHFEVQYLLNDEQDN